MTTSDAPTLANIYDTDVYRWACEQAEHIRAGRFDKVDLINAAEEIDDVGLRQYDAVVSNLQIVLMHMLKWDFQPARRSRSWERSIDIHRDRIEYRFARSPSLQAKRDEMLVYAYKSARRRAGKETNLGLTAFPDTCPYDWDAIMTRPFVLDQTRSDPTHEAS